ncbi:ngoBVM [Symbiodinium sp. CCMP2592]|nr:ngoBVM [Symbiodinium sp. CCMP2592]CAE7417222.1 ngoBVM [Symbiodinium sp. CCMP2592]
MQRQQHRVLTVGSACTGLASELFAARRLNLRVRSVFGCDCDSASQTWNQEMWEHERFFNNVLSTEFMEEPESESADIFVCGPPCQPFSRHGLGLGQLDPRAAAFDACLRWIELRHPRVFIIENVCGLLESHPQFLEYVMKRLSLVRAGGRSVYFVTLMVLNPRLHCGIPQHRERVFIIGCQAAHMVREVEVPPEVPMQSILAYTLPEELVNVLDQPTVPSAGSNACRVLQESLERIILAGGDPESEPYVIDVGRSTPHYNYDYCPCLTRARAGGKGFFLSWRMRHMSVYEMLMLQGIQPEEVLGTSLSLPQLGKLCGNAMCVDVLALVMQSALRAVGLLEPDA